MQRCPCWLFPAAEVPITATSCLPIPLYQSGAVRLMTLHGAKGLEFPVVFLAGVTKGALPVSYTHLMGAHIQQMLL